MWYFEDEAWWSSVTSSHLLKQDCVDAQTGGRVGCLTQKPGGQTEKQETPKDVSTTTTKDTTAMRAGQWLSEDVNKDYFSRLNGISHL